MRATPCIAVGVYTGRKLSAAAGALDRAAQGALSEVLRRGDMEGKLGSALILYRIPGITAERVLLVGLGEEADLREREYREAARAAIKAAQETGSGTLTLCFGEIKAGRRDAAWKARQVALVAAECAYRFDSMKSKKSDPRPLAHVELLTAAREANAAARGLRQGGAIGAGVSLAKDLGNLPGNVCTPTFLAEQARKIAKEWKLGFELLGRKDMEKLGMGSLLSVAQGSRQPPKLIVLKYAGGPKKAKPVVLVGKGITFDTGGISLKPGAVVDIATLPGACVIALGHVASGLYSNKEALARELLAAGDEVYDRAWHMPLWDDYQEQLKSNFADMANIGGRPAGSVTAACFLSRFAKKFDWAHLDIAGTAWKSGKEKGSTGRPVALLASFLMKRAGKGQ